MLELILTLAIYSVIILIFVPLDKISRAQIKVRAWWRKLVNKVKD